jgi:hypothetical protein
MSLIGSWTLYFSWQTSSSAPIKYSSAPIIFFEGGGVSGGANWVLKGSNVSWSYDNNDNTYTGVIEGDAMVGTMTGSFNGGYWYAINDDTQHAVTAGESAVAAVSSDHVNPPKGA